MSKREKRLELILERVNHAGAVSVRDLSDRLHVTGVTIRRDLSQLHRESRLRLMHGVAVSNTNNQNEDEEYRVVEAETHRAAEKRIIGKAAAELVEADDILIIDTGTTTECIANSLSPALPITVICNSLNIVNLLSDSENCRLIVPGGVFRKSSMMFESESGIRLMREVRAQKAFISASGFDERLGVTCTNMYEIGPKRAAIESASMRVLVIDSSKFGSVRVAYFADIEDFDVIITDEGISKKYEDIINERGLKLIKVKR